MTPKRVIAKRASRSMQGLAVLAEQLVEQRPAGGVGQGPEHVVHTGTLGDHLVTCQGPGCGANRVALPASDDGARLALRRGVRRRPGIVRNAVNSAAGAAEDSPASLAGSGRPAIRVHVGGNASGPPAPKDPSAVPQSRSTRGRAHTIDVAARASRGTAPRPRRLSLAFTLASPVLLAASVWSC